MKRLVIATRGSRLALWQSEHIRDLIKQQHPDIDVELNVVVTSGDKIVDVPLAKIGGKGLFLKEIEETMLRGEAHIAVHSLKDVPTRMPDGLKLTAVTRREDVRDAMLSEKYADFESLPKGAVVGTSSLRRKMQLLSLRPDLTIKWLRGNVDTRIRKLKEGQFDAIILAAAGITRLELTQETTHFYPLSLYEMIPAMGQGALGIECIDDPDVEALVAFLEDEDSRIETTIEREFVDTLEGGCQVPIGVNSTAMENGDVITRAILGLPDATQLLTETRLAKRGETAGLGREIAQKLIKRGAKALLSQAEQMAGSE